MCMYWLEGVSPTAKTAAVSAENWKNAFDFYWNQKALQNPMEIPSEKKYWLYSNEHLHYELILSRLDTFI